MSSVTEGVIWFRRVRFRLALVYVAVAALLFAASFITTFFLVRHAVLRQLSRDLERNRVLFTSEYARLAGPDRLVALQKEFDEESAEIGVNALYLMLVSPRGDVLACSPLGPSLRAAMRHVAAVPVPNFSAPGLTGRIRRVRASVQILPDGNRLVVGLDRTRIDGRLGDLVAVLVGSFALVLFVAVVAGLVFAPFVTRAAETAFADLSRATDAIAHDLRTPVTRLRGRAELALMRDDSSGLANDVAEECSSMLEMINTMLDIAATEHDVRSSPRERLDLVALVRSIVELYVPAAEDKGVHLAAVLPAGSVVFAGHRSKFQQLLGNLLDNAVKFTPKGGSITVTLAADHEGAIVLAVRDTGCGIAAADLPRVFERFYRADTARTFPGNGLGLSLVKAVVTSYGGDVALESAPGHGTAVTVTLPAP